MIIIKLEDITKEDVEVIVNAARNLKRSGISVSRRKI